MNSIEIMLDWFGDRGWMGQEKNATEIDIFS